MAEELDGLKVLLSRLDKIDKDCLEKKMFPKLMKDELERWLVWIISTHICFGRSFYNRTCKIIGDWHSSNSYLNYSRQKK